MRHSGVAGGSSATLCPILSRPSCSTRNKIARGRQGASRRSLGKGLAAAKQAAKAVASARSAGGAAARLRAKSNGERRRSASSALGAPLKTPPCVTKRRFRSLSGTAGAAAARHEAGLEALPFFLPPLQSTAAATTTAAGPAGRRRCLISNWCCPSLPHFSLFALHLEHAHERGDDRETASERESLARARPLPRADEESRDRTLFESMTSVMTTSLPASAP